MKLPRVTTTIAALAGLVTGLVGGNIFFNCRGSRECGLDAAVAGALGTWIGGVATAAAVLVAGSQLLAQLRTQSNDHHRRVEREKAAALRHAKQFAFRGEPGSRSDHKGIQFTSVRVRNTCGSAMEDVKIYLAQSKKLLAEEPLIIPHGGRSVEVTMADLGLPPLEGRPEQMGHIIQNKVLPEVAISFTLEYRTFRIIGKQAPEDITPRSEG